MLKKNIPVIHDHHIFHATTFVKVFFRYVSEA